MKILGDYHTHTRYSKFGHGKDTIAEMVDAAEKAGLKEIAITEHGPRHLFGILNKNILKARREIDEINKTSKVRVLFGLECNLLGLGGENDLPKKHLDLFDIRLVGFHRAVIGNVKGIFNLSLANLCKKDKMIEKNTDAYINAIKKYKFDIITHPQEYIRINPKRLAEACAENGTFIEINNRHCIFSEADIKAMLETKVLFVLSSDAHRAECVAEVDKALQTAIKYGIPAERIANLDKLPELKAH